MEEGAAALFLVPCVPGMGCIISLIPKEGEANNKPLLFVGRGETAGLYDKRLSRHQLRVLPSGERCILSLVDTPPLSSESN